MSAEPITHKPPRSVLWETMKKTVANFMNLTDEKRPHTLTAATTHTENSREPVRKKGGNANPR